MTALTVRASGTTGAAARPLGRAYWSLCGAGLASSMGDGAVLVGFPLLASTLTRDPRALAAVAVAQRIPWLLLSLFTGALADRLDRRRLIGAVETLRMATVGALGASVALHLHPLAAVYLAAFTLGSFETAFTAASGAVIPELVDRSSLGRANGYLYAAQMSGEGVLGPALGGLLAAGALAMPFLFDAATFSVSAVILLVALPARLGAAPGAGSEPVLDGMREGLRWFRANRPVRLIAGFVSCMAFCQTAVFAVLVLWAQRYLHTSRAGYGTLISVAAFGVVGAALVAGRVMDRFAPGRLLLGAGAVAGATYVGLGLTTSWTVAAGALLVEGAAVSLGNVVSGALRQSLIPGELLGRVGNAMRTCIFGAMPAGALAGGLAAGAAGLRTTFVAAGLLQVGAAAVLGRPLLRALSEVREAPAAEPAVERRPAVFDQDRCVLRPLWPVDLAEGAEAPAPVGADGSEGLVAFVR